MDYAFFIYRAERPSAGNITILIQLKMEVGEIQMKQPQQCPGDCTAAPKRPVLTFDLIADCKCESTNCDFLVQGGRWGPQCVEGEIQDEKEAWTHFSPCNLITVYPGKY